MKIRYNKAAIMAKASQLTREQLVRDQQFLSVGMTPPPSQLRSFAYNLKIAWSMAKNGKHDILNGYTAGSWFELIIVVEG